MARPYRSALYIPASRERALDKARGLSCDAILFDLEDAVAPEEKVRARETLAAALASGGYGARARLVRINGLDTEWGEDDLRAAAGLACDGVLVPKVDGPATLDRVAALVPDLPLWAMMETPAGILNAAAICAHPRLAGIVMGTNDLAKDLRTRPGHRREPLLHALSACLLAARAHGRVAIDGVYNAFRDAEGLEAECAQGRDLGFDGKSLIHPDQIALANAAFAPTGAEIDLARRQIAAFDEASAAGQGVAVVDGRIVENLHVATARETLSRAEAIAALETT
ncbi:HpcH/HpaI aldolase/citrate lyase family protein [Wenxinia marina]|uniref:Citrate lyase beta subunit n=1 Tax=Wenxinia marina DSM 24838 TaxID=1123501 RepID=A0A0D0NQE3_9RHOB|nr:CoA ester lyase [Wenxinia marina]KIQ70495.1 Citrate lyase beta subunit [Wenxinia marina DSM 24838]GGL52656.1 (3S)-malyl-CoA thioesterase [Wenxinia marina]